MLCQKPAASADSRARRRTAAVPPAGRPPGPPGAPTSQVAAYLSAALGPARLAAISEALSRPSLRPTLRVNTLRASPEQVAAQLQRAPASSGGGDGGAGTSGGGVRVAAHPVVPSALVVEGSGPYVPRYAELTGGRLSCCCPVGVRVCAYVCGLAHTRLVPSPAPPCKRPTPNQT